jgi:hypothetical protein
MNFNSCVIAIDLTKDRKLCVFQIGRSFQYVQAPQGENR